MNADQENQLLVDMTAMRTSMRFLIGDDGNDGMFKDLKVKVDEMPSRTEVTAEIKRIHYRITEHEEQQPEVCFARLREYIDEAISKLSPTGKFSFKQMLIVIAIVALLCGSVPAAELIKEVIT